MCFSYCLKYIICTVTWQPRRKLTQYTGDDLAAMFLTSRSMAYNRLHEINEANVSLHITDDFVADRLRFAPFFIPRIRKKRRFRTFICASCHQEDAAVSGPIPRYCHTCVPNYIAGGRMARFGLTEPEYMSLYDAQNGTCAICGKCLVHRKVKGESAFTTIDHSHITGKIRGILCMRCNRQLSALEDYEWKEKALIYLAKYDT